MKKFIKFLLEARKPLLITISALFALCYFGMAGVGLITGEPMFVDDPIEGGRILSYYPSQLLSLATIFFVVPGAFALYTLGNIAATSVLKQEGWLMSIIPGGCLFYATGVSMMYGSAFSALGVTPELFGDTLTSPEGIYGYTIAGSICMIGFARGLALKEDCLSLATL